MGAPEDIGAFLRLLEGRGEVRRIGAEVDPVLEIAAITDRVCKTGEGGPVLFFERVKGHPFPVVTNLFGTLRRTAEAFGVDDVEKIAARLAAELASGEGASVVRLRRLVETPRYLPRKVEAAPCREVVLGEPDLTEIPALRNWPQDGGRFLTLPLVFTRHPETGRPNCGMYRVQIFDRSTAALHWGKSSGGALHAAAWAARGERMPVSVVLGGPPALIHAASAPLPDEVDETAFAGFLRGAPVETVSSLTSDLEIPASAEFVLEGYVEPGEARVEGPFGNHTGFYAPAAPAPVLRLVRMTRRRRPIYPCTVVGPPPMENRNLALATERIFLPLIQTDFPEVADIRFLPEVIFHGCALVSVRAAAGGRALDLIRRLWRTPLLRHSRLLVAVDAELDADGRSTLLWRIANRVDLPGDMLVEDGKLGIDATDKGGRPRLRPDADVQRKVAERWQEYGID